MPEETKPDETKPDADKGTAETPTLTQADLNRVVEQRLARLKRDHERQMNALRAALGVDESDGDLVEIIKGVREELRATSARGGDGDDRQDGELAKLHTRIEALEAEHKTAIENLNARTRDRLIDAEIRALIGRAGDKLTADAGLLLAPQLKTRLGVDPETFEVFPTDEKGERLLDKSAREVDTGTLLATMLDQFPSLVKAGGGGSGAQPGRGQMTDAVAAAVAATAGKTGRQAEETVVRALFGRRS